MKLIKYFDKFLIDSVNLNATRLADLDSRVASITAALKASNSIGDRILDTVPQGSWAHKTIIRPASDLEFDADFLVQLAEDSESNENPRSYANALWLALSNDTIYGPMSRRKDRCIRVTYANDCHIDIISYVQLANGREVIVNRNTNEFEDTNPIGFSDWIQEKDNLTNGNLRKVIRLLKYLRDQQGSFKLKSVLLTTLVGNIVAGWRAYDSDYYKDVPTTLLNLVEDLDRWLQVRISKPSISDPSCPATTFDHRWTDAQYRAFREDIHELAVEIRAAFDVATIDESISAWREVFGLAFPSSVVSAQAAVAEARLGKFEGRRAPKERFIDEMFPVSVTESVQISCEVSAVRDLNRVRRRALRARAGRVPKQQDLHFEVIDTSVLRPYDIYWKVRNFGQEAERSSSLRGEIVRDEGQLRRKESTLYAGNHYVECYVVKSGVCVAQTRVPVIIS